MKIGNYNGHQSKMLFLIDEVMSAVISDCEYYMAVYNSHIPQHKEAKAFLSQGHDKLAAYFYKEVMRRSAHDSYYRHARFAGSDFLKEKIDKRLKLWDL